MVPDQLQLLIPRLTGHLKADHRLALNACLALSSLTKSVYCNKRGDEARQPVTFELSEFYAHIIEELVETSQRIPAAYEALQIILVHSAADCNGIVQSTVDLLLQQLKQVSTSCVRLFSQLS